MKCWLNRTGRGRCNGNPKQWIILEDGNFYLPVEIWLCRSHESVPFDEVFAASRPTTHGERARREVTQLRPLS